MRIAIIQTNDKINEVFTHNQLLQLRAMGELSINEGDNTIEQAKKTIRNADIAITMWGTPRLTADILDCAPDLRLIAHTAGSIRSFASDAVWQREIMIVNSSNVLGTGVAETAIGLTIACCKNFFQLNSEAHAGSFYRHDVKELSNITIGVIGAGWSGRHYIQLLKCYEVNIMVYDPYMAEADAQAIGVTKTTLDELLISSDVVSIHAPSIPETDNMICAKTLKLMKKDAILINTARGSLINEQDLYNHMKAGFLKYACLDVFKKEPVPPDHPLNSLSNVIITPHIAGIVDNGKYQLGRNVVDEIGRFINGEKLLYRVTRAMSEKMT